MKTNRLISLALLLLVAGQSGCDPDLTDDAIPYVNFPEILIDLNLPAYTALKTDGGSMYFNDGGVRGLILYRESATSYLAWERNCSFQPNEACATVNIDASGLFMADACCGSTFSFERGNPTGGVAWRPLRRYSTSLSSSTLTITDQIVQ